MSDRPLGLNGASRDRARKRLRQTHLGRQLPVLRLLQSHCESPDPAGGDPPPQAQPRFEILDSWEDSSPESFLFLLQTAVV